MKYTLHIEFTGTHIHAAVSGENTLENVLGYLDEIYVACMKHQCSSVLIEENLTGPNLDTFEIFEVIIKNFSKATSIGLRLAYVDLNLEHSKRGLKFAENLAHIRGVNVRLFYDPETALKWLLNPGITS